MAGPTTNYGPGPGWPVQMLEGVNFADVPAAPDEEPWWDPAARVFSDADGGVTTPAVALDNVRHWTSSTGIFFTDPAEVGEPTRVPLGRYHTTTLDCLAHGGGGLIHNHGYATNADDWSTQDWHLLMQFSFGPATEDFDVVSLYLLELVSEDDAAVSVYAADSGPTDITITVETKNPEAEGGYVVSEFTAATYGPWYWLGVRYTTNTTLEVKLFSGDGATVLATVTQDLSGSPVDPDHTNLYTHFNSENRRYGIGRVWRKMGGHYTDARAAEIMDNDEIVTPSGSLPI